MKTTYTDGQLQAVIDYAIRQSSVSELTTVFNGDDWASEELERLTVAKAFLEKLGPSSSDAELERIIKAAHKAGWNGVENSKDLAQFITDTAEEVGNRQAALLDAATSIDELKKRVDKWFKKSKAENEKYLKAVEEIGRLEKLQTQTQIGRAHV